MDEDEEILVPSDHGEVRIFPSPSYQSALLVRQALIGKPLAEITRTFGASWAAVQRLENPRHSPTIRQLDGVAATLGKRLVLTFE